MLDRFRRAGLVWPTVWLVPALALMMSLGVWQWQRHAWKAELIGQIEMRTRAGAIPLGDALAAAARGQSVEYTRVRIEGRFDHGTESFLYSPEREGPGYHLYTHVETTDGEVVIINRGFIPQALKPQSMRAASLATGPTVITGLLRAPRPAGWFAPPSEPTQRLFFHPDHAGMLALAARSGGAGKAVVPFFVDADRGAGASDYPRGGVTRLDLPNRHLEYAFTWWGLALTLIGVYTVFARGRLAELTAAR